MKIQATAEQCRAIAESLRPLNVSLYTHKSGDAKYNAQQNLEGRTHYVDSDTLRWHHSRVNSSGQIGNSWGLLFRITESVALDMNNHSRGSRCVVFDVFGTVVYHPDLESTFRNSAAAEKACNATEFDLIGHYREAIKSKLHYLRQDVKTLEAIETLLSGMETPAQLALNAAAPVQTAWQG